jgi:hypothetical protein
MPPCRLAYNEIGPEGAKALAPALAASASLTSLDLSLNNLCKGKGFFGRTIHTSKGIKMIAKALKVNASLTKIS